MQKISLIPILLLFTVIVPSVAQHTVEPQRVNVTGVVLNPQPDQSTIRLIINDVATNDQISLTSQLDEEGRFSFEFDRYFSQDVMLYYATVIQVFVSPGENLQVELDGSLNEREEIYRNIRFSGDAREKNEQLAAYWEGFSVFLKDYNENNNERVVHLRPEKYRNLMDSMGRVYQGYWEDFVETHQPVPVIKKWTYLHWNAFRANALFLYALLGSRHLPDSVEVDESYYSFVEDIPALDISSLVSTDMTSNFINRYQFGLVYRKMMEDHAEGNMRRSSNLDSLRISYINKYSPSGNILRTLLLSAAINSKLQSMDTSMYHAARPYLNELEQYPMIFQPMNEQYHRVKDQLENAKLSEKAHLREVEGKQDLLAGIVKAYRGKRIYIDVWGTWCAPCISEFPNSKALKAEQNDDSLIFLYLGIQSEEDKWKAMIAQHDLEGEHILLNRDQSNILLSELGISGIPFYLLIDEQGNIVEKGNHLRPRSERLKELLGLE